MLSARSMLTCAGGVIASLLIVGSVLLCQHTGAAVTTDESKPNAAAPPAEPKKIATKPSWKSLSPAQQQALAPLAGEWDSMDSLRKQKWLAIGNRYAKMSPAEQERVQTRMRDWLKLTPEQRRTVRQSYNSTQKLNPDQKSAQWQEYQQLSDEQKQKFEKQKPPPAPATAVPHAKSKPAALLPRAVEPLHETTVAPGSSPAAPANPVTPGAIPPAGAAAVQSNTK